MYGNTSVLIMGEAKRRKNLGIPPREKTEDIKLPQLDKKAIQQKVRSTLYKYPIIPFLFYGAAILILIGGLFYVFKSFNVASFPFIDICNATMARSGRVLAANQLIFPVYFLYIFSSTSLNFSSAFPSLKLSI